MRGGTERYPGRLNGMSPRMYISNIYPYMVIMFSRTFSSRPGKAGSRQKRDNFYHVNKHSVPLRQEYADFTNCRE